MGAGPGLERAIVSTAHSEFRQTLTAEAVAVLAAMRVGAEIRLCDRLHVETFNRIVQRHSLDDLRYALIQATELIAKMIEERRAKAIEKGAAGSVRWADLPQNLLNLVFKEMSSER